MPNLRFNSHITDQTIINKLTTTQNRLWTTPKIIEKYNTTDHEGNLCQEIILTSHNIKHSNKQKKYTVRVYND